MAVVPAPRILSHARHACHGGAVRTTVAVHHRCGALRHKTHGIGVSRRESPRRAPSAALPPSSTGAVVPLLFHRPLIAAGRLRMRPVALLAACLTMLPAAATDLLAQGGGIAPASAPPGTPPPVRPADPADVGTIDGIIAALYASISGPKDAPRDVERLRTLFGPSARMIPTGEGANGKAFLRNWSVEEYIAAAMPGLMRNGFFEKEIGRRSDTFGHITHVMSVYDSRTTPEAPPFQRGINSIQLFHSGERWYILSVMWDSERPNNPIPPDRIGGR